MIMIITPMTFWQLSLLYTLAIKLHNCICACFQSSVKIYPLIIAPLLKYFLSVMKQIFPCQLSYQASFQLNQ